MITIDDFRIRDIQIGLKPDYNPSKLEAYIKAVKTMSLVEYNEFYIADYFKNEFLYVSKDSFFLCGHTASEIQSLGFNFYIQHIPEKYLSKILEVRKQYFKLFNRLQTEEKKEASLLCTFPLVENSIQYNVVLKIKPLELTKDNKLWLSLCCLSLSPKPNEISAYCHIENKKSILKFNFDNHKWEDNQQEPLTKNELTTLRLYANGYKTKDIAITLNKSTDCIRWYKKKILKKLNVDSMTQATIKAKLFRSL